MKVKNKNKRLLDKGFHTHYSDNRDRIKYDRAYVKNRMSDVMFLPFSKTSYESRWHDDWENEGRRLRYIAKFIEKNIGKPADEVYSELSRCFGFSDPTICRESWNWTVETDPSRLRDGVIYVNEYGNLDRFNGKSKPKYRHGKECVWVPKKVWGHNSKNQVPNFGKVRVQPEGCFTKWYENSITPLGMCMRKLPGKWYVLYKNEWLLLSVYIFPTKPNTIEKSFQSCSVYTKEGLLRHDFYTEYSYRRYNRETKTYEMAYGQGNLGYGILPTYISIKEAENELWKALNKEE